MAKSWRGARISRREPFEEMRGMSGMMKSSRRRPSVATISFSIWPTSPPANSDSDPKRIALTHALPSRQRSATRTRLSHVTSIVRSRSGSPRRSAGSTRSPATGRIRDIRLDGLLEFSADDVPADDVCDRADGAEPLQAKEIREAAERTDLAGGLLRDWNRLIRRDREIPQDDLEPIAHEVPNLERAVGTREIEHIDVFHPQGLDRLRGDILEGEELRREGALVLGPRESDSAAADVQSPRKFPHQAVRLPVANAERSDRVPSIDHGRLRGGDLLDHKVFRGGLEGAPEAGGRRQVPFDPDVTFHGPTRAPSPGRPSPRRTPPRALRQLA